MLWRRGARQRDEWEQRRGGRPAPPRRPPPSSQCKDSPECVGGDDTAGVWRSAARRRVRRRGRGSGGGDGGGDGADIDPPPPTPRSCSERRDPSRPPPLSAATTRRERGAAAAAGAGAGEWGAGGGEVDTPSHSAFFPLCFCPPGLLFVLCSPVSLSRRVRLHGSVGTAWDHHGREMVVRVRHDERAAAGRSIFLFM